MERHPQVVYTKRSFLSQTAQGLSVFAVTLTICAAAIILYGMNIASTKAGDFMSFTGTVVKGLPEIKKELPPLIADVINDRRRPDYRSQIEISARISPLSTRRGTARLGIEVVNKGSELVSLLSLRIVALDAGGEPLCERNEWAATPIAADDDWPGPLMPGSRRHLTTRFVPINGLLVPEAVTVEVEITDIRVWVGEEAPDSRKEQV